MNNWMNSLVDSSVQCWGCDVFDRMFQIVSVSAASVYKQFAIICAIIFCVLFAFFAINAVWQNIKGGVGDPWYKKSIRPVFINALVAMAFLSMGVMLPRAMTQITFEPTAQIALIYTQSMLQTNSDIVNAKVTYQPTKMDDNGFFRPQLRDTIILLMKTTITQFQSYMKLGIAMMDNAFSWRAILNIGTLIKHIVMFAIGLYLFYGFFKLFVRFCFYFADIIIAMTFFAFFFPLSLVMMSFRGASDVPKWMSGIGAKLGTGQFKNLINAIIALAAAVLTYTVMMVVIAKFFSAPGASAAELMQNILSGDVFAGDLSDANVATLTITSSVVLVYVLNFIYSQIPKVTKMVLSAFDVDADHKLGDQLADDAMGVSKKIIDALATTGKTILAGGETKSGGTK